MFQELPYKPHIPIQLLPLLTYHMLTLYGVFINSASLKISVRDSLSHLTWFKSYKILIILQLKVYGNLENITIDHSQLWYLKASAEWLKIFRTCSSAVFTFSSSLNTTFLNFSFSSFTCEHKTHLS
jgi:hypothetical protein